MNEDLKRLEDKQKLANFQIEKRFVSLEKSFDEIKTSLEKASLLENVPKELSEIRADIKKINYAMDKFRTEKEKDFEQMTALVDSVDVSDIRKEVEEIKREVDKFGARFEQELKGVEMLEERILVGKTDEKIHDLFIKLNQVSTKIDAVNLKMATLETKKLSEPIFIE